MSWWIIVLIGLAVLLVLALGVIALAVVQIARLGYDKSCWKCKGD